MKKILLTSIIISLFLNVIAQELPQQQLKSIKGKIVDTKSFAKNDGKPVLICFFATWCKPCIKELDTYNDLYDDWKEETGVKIIVISTDNARTSSRVGPFVDSKAWDFEFYLDPNGDFKRAMNVVNEPHTFLLDGKGKIVWQHSSYMPGDEKKVYETIKKVAEGKAIK